MKYPCYVQPKLDGIRAIAIGNELYSRNGFPFPTFDHVKAELPKNTEKLILDGELYTNEIPFEELSGLTKRVNLSKVDKEHLLKMHYYVFDYIDTEIPMSQRVKNLEKFFKNHPDFKCIKHVLTEECESANKIESFLEKYTKMGYEGLIIRNPHAPYHTNKRSNDLLKLKRYQDKEYEIIDFVKPEYGKEKGCVVWVCKTEDGKKFNVRPLGSFEDRKVWYENGKDFIGKMITVKFQELTHDGVPRFPVGVAIRDYE